MFLRVDMNSLEAFLKKAAGSSFLFVDRLRIRDEEAPELFAYDITDAIAQRDGIVVDEFNPPVLSFSKVL